MKRSLFIKTFFITIILFTTGNTFSQQESIKDLEFLIGEWEVREDNIEKNWWEKSKRTSQYILDSTYIQLKSVAIASNGKKRTYHWLIHYNDKAQQFEMVSIYSNWSNVEFDILYWDSKKRTLIIQNKQDSDIYHERIGKIVFTEDFNEYTWIGENKYGNRDNPSIWKYIEKGARIK